jgi:autotransporter-associated beta strand protein
MAVNFNNRARPIHPRGLKRVILSAASALLAPVLMVATVHAGSATWNSNPGSGDWNTSANWTPATVPNGPGDVATFATSAQTAVSISNGVTVDGITFSPGASAYTISYITTLIFDGAGIVNNSGAIQNILPFSDGINTPITFFYGSASAGTSTIFTNSGVLEFNDTTTAGNATIINKGTANAASGGRTDFYNSSTAGNGIFVLAGGEADGGNGGVLTFDENSTADEGTFTVQGNMASQTGGGNLSFHGDSSAGNGNFTVEGNRFSNPSPLVGFVAFFGNSTANNAAITVNGSTVSGAAGGLAEFADTATAGNATLVANGGSAGGFGGQIEFFGDATGGTAAIAVFGNGSLDISPHNAPGVKIGSIEGNGQVFLGARNLTVGTNNQSKTFSGVIHDGGSNGGTGGSLTKDGTGKLSLSKPSTYTGSTTLSAGTLLVTNRTGSATGTGSVQVNMGTLGGTGTITGSVTVGTGSNPEAIVLPGKNAASPGTLTINSALTFNTGSTYKCALNRSTVITGQIAALGVTINSRASFKFIDVGAGTLTVGTVFTVINNTSASPITGTFRNLPDGSTFASNGNNFQVSYMGGSGNDLTLTVVP